MRFAVDHSPRDHLGLRIIATDKEYTTEIDFPSTVECRVKQLIVIISRAILAIAFMQSTDTNCVTNSKKIF